MKSSKIIVQGREISIILQKENEDFFDKNTNFNPLKLN